MKWVATAWSHQDLQVKIWYKDGYKSDQETGMDVYCWKSNSQFSILLGIHSSANMEMPKRTGGLEKKQYVAKEFICGSEPTSYCEP